MEVKEKCSACKNMVVGELKRSRGSKLARNVVKKGGMKSVLTLAGSVIPGFGNVAGFAAGTVIDTLYGDKINKLVDAGVDLYKEDSLYIFKCPNCGKTWSKHTTPRDFLYEQMIQEIEEERSQALKRINEEYEAMLKREGAVSNEYSDGFPEQYPEHNGSNRISVDSEDRDKPFKMTIDDVFNITGRGTVVTGRIETGRVRVGDKVQIIGYNTNNDIIVTAIEMFRKFLDEGEAGDECGIVLRNVKSKDIKPGMIICEYGVNLFV